MKIIYLCEEKENIKRVFGTDETVFTKADILSSKENLKETEIIFSTWGMSVLSEEEIKEYLPNLKAVFYAAGSVQYFARPFLNCGVRVFSAWAANAVPVAEYTVSQIILSNKGFFKTMNFKNKTEAYKLFEKFEGNYGAKVGLIGVGMIGSMVAERLKDYNLEVLAYDKFLSDEKAEVLGVKKVSLETIFSCCSVISNHLANNPQTVGLLNKELFSMMPQFATFLNTGRGAQVVEADLISVLKERPDITAVLDVTEPEPPVSGSEFYTLENCILTPHIAGSSGLEVRRMADYMKEEFESYQKGEPQKYEVTLEMLKTMA
jgi:phosphoglycerate dehydrogenase-like enzyme